jgi:hypothetical protein
VATTDFCVSSSRSVFVGGSIRNKPGVLKVPTCSTDITDIINVGGGVEIHQDSLNNIAKLRTLKSSDATVSIALDGSTIDLTVAGGGSDKNLAVDQITPITTLNIIHSLGKYPSVTLLDTLGAEIWGDVKQNTVNDVTVEFSEAIAFKAIFN